MSALPVVEEPPYFQSNEGLFGDFDVPIPCDDILPVYTTIRQSSSELTSVTRPSRVSTTRTPKEFQYKIKSGKDAPIAVLTLVANAPYSKDIPTYIGSGPVKGSALLRADKADGLQAIAVSIIGRYIAGIEEEETIFLEFSTTIYSNSSELPKAKDDSYLWPFELKIPAELTLPVWKQGKEEEIPFVPPQTFTERLLRGSIKYEIGMKVKRRGLLRTSYRISTTIGYIPLIRPPSLPLLRSLAYEQGMQLVGPQSDPEGWQALDEVRFKESLSTISSDIEIGCTLHIAYPLSYTIGTSIPLVLRLTVHADSRHALDALLQTPNAITVRLRRTVTSHLPQRKLKSGWNYHLTNSKEVGDLYEAVWWPAPEGTQAGGVSNLPPPETGNVNSNNHVRWMSGEIPIGKEVKPSSGMPYFKIEYTVVLLQFTTPGAKSAHTKQTQVLQEQVVEIVTSFAPGPRPVRYAPPGYTSNSIDHRALE